ncbi:hypothetical protein UFOVP703_54 [uncultured Caudovirales phage]|uniref:Uncharacterized protein n=1 Tax=uncultured Caudovirales phage TaxID=2100421 RepID=A0A6J5NPX8_9CAUD|nr:hypothetical protein UFOVP703_54 [uncultured Caudovirales phage]
MTQLTLLDAVNAGVQGHQQGMQIRQQREAQAKAKKEEGMLEQANMAAAQVFEESKAEWAINGALGTYQPNELTMMRAAEARGMAFARSGDWGNFMKNSAAVTGLRTQVRQRALERFEQDGDAEALVRSMHSTVFDGKKIKGIEKVEASEAYSSDTLKTPARAGGVEVTFDDGSRKFVQVPELVKSIKLAMIDPAEYAAKEAAHELAMAQIRERRDANKAEIKARGEEDRKTADRRGEISLNLEGVKFGNDRTLQSERLASEEKQAKTRADGSVAAAKVRGDAPPKPGNELVDAKRLNTLLVGAGITNTRDPVSQRATPDDLTAKVQPRVQGYIDKGWSPEEAVAKVRQELEDSGHLPKARR